MEALLLARIQPYQTSFDSVIPRTIRHSVYFYRFGLYRFVIYVNPALKALIFSDFLTSISIPLLPPA